MITFELIIFKNLFENKEYISKVLPYLKQEYFEATRQDQRILFKLVKGYVTKYKKMPTYSGMKTILQKQNKISETVFASTIELIEQVEQMPLDEWDLQWLFDQTEEFCKLSALEIAIMAGMDKIEKKERLSDIPEIMQKALGINFDASLGLNYFSTSEIDERWSRYHEKKEKFPCDIKGLNSVTNGGIERKTLNILMGGLGTGKSSSLVSMACDHVERGCKVIYFSFEMDDYKICHRVDAHFLKTPINEIEFMDEEHYKETLANLGYEDSLIVKEYPEGQATVATIKNILDDLKLKKDFVPDLVFIDYLNIMDSTRCNKGQVNTYTYVKNITEEVRAFAKEENLGVWSATQSNKGSLDKNDVSLNDTSESVGLPQTVDLHVAIIETPDMNKRGIQIWKNLKDRYSGSKYTKFVVSPGFATATCRDFEGDTSDLLDELETINKSKRNEKIENMRAIHKDEDKMKEIKEGFGEML